MIISPEKRNNLIKLGLATVAVLVAFWFFLIRPASAELSGKAKIARELSEKVSAKKQVMQRAEQIKEELDEAKGSLQAIEEQMVVGDTYLWIIKTLSEFEIPNQIEFSKYDPPQVVESIDSQNLPYKTVSYAVNGTATYHDFGKFLAEFENSHPYIRIHRIDMEPAEVGFSSREKLLFLMELRVLMKPAEKTSSTTSASRL